MSTTPPAERLRFQGFVLDRLPNSRCRAQVHLSWVDDQVFVGEAEGLASPSGELRCAADACVAALAKAVRGEASLELLGVKAVKAFDNNVVIVSLAYQEKGAGQRLVGCFLAENDSARGAALAVLNATNRVLGNRFFMR
ncbi:MAG TPA: hypothetical protein VFS28_00025 [Gemmatimonadales bacterium]|nr:hypothetical protein [Gemmatimonadales bacterium]